MFGDLKQMSEFEAPGADREIGQRGYADGRERNPRSRWSLGRRCGLAFGQRGAEGRLVEQLLRRDPGNTWNIVEARSAVDDRGG